MTKRTLESTRHQVPDDPAAVWEYFYEKGWCDGLPVVPPTAERVSAMLATLDRDSKEVVVKLSPSYNEVTLEKIAVNAVMAGCAPACLRVVVTAVEAIAEPRFRLLPMGTPPATPLIILNGPIRQELGINCGYSALGGITRSNATIGRALRLVILNLGLGGAHVIRDQATLGMPTRISFCLGENEEASPWEPLHVERGFRREDSTVTLVNAVSPVNILDQEAKSAESLIITLAGSMTIQGTNNMCRDPAEPFLLLGQEHACLLASGGMSKQDVRSRIWERAFIPLEAFSPENQEFIRRSGRPVHEGRVHIVKEPEHLRIVVAGGLGPHSQFLSTIGHTPQQSVTRLIPKGKG